MSLLLFLDHFLYPVGLLSLFFHSHNYITAKFLPFLSLEPKTPFTLIK